MSPSLPSPSCSWRHANIRQPNYTDQESVLEVILLLSAEISCYGGQHCIFRSNMNKMWVELLHALVQCLAEGTGIHIALTSHSKIWLFLPLQDSSTSTHSSSGLRRHLEAEPHNGQVFAKRFYHFATPCPCKIQPGLEEFALKPQSTVLCRIWARNMTNTSNHH